MEVSGVVFRPLPCFSGAGFDAHSSKTCFSSLSIDTGNCFSGELRLVGSRDSRFSVRARRFPGFSNHGHLQYYVSPRSGTKNKEKKNSEMATIKKKMKLMKGLLRDLLMFSSIGFGVQAEDGLIAEVKGKKISEATEVLLAQLQHLRAEEKEMKRKKKEDKARLKANRMGTEIDSKSPSSSSESSDNESGEVVNMSRLRSGDVAEPTVELQEAYLAEATSTNASLFIPEQKIVEGEQSENHNLLNCGQDCGTESGISCGSGSSVAVGASAERIEVCMGGKCKKFGAVALLEEFERRIETEGAVVGCKCMGKCRDGPNVRVLNHSNNNLIEGVDASVRSPTNPLCIGVGLEDVSLIVANFFGKERNNLGVMAAA